MSTWEIVLPLWIIAVGVFLLLFRMPKDMDAMANQISILPRLLNKAVEELSAINVRLKDVSTLQIKDLSLRAEPLDEIQGELVQLNNYIRAMARNSGAIVGPGGADHP